MRKIVVLLLSVLLYTDLVGQTQVFKTYEDFVNGNGISMDSQNISWGSGISNYVIFENNDEKKIKFQINKIWGFKYKGHLFRSVGKELAMLTDSGKVNYYLNGSAGLGILASGGNSGSIYSGQSACFLSVGGVNEKIYRMPLDKFKKLDYNEFKRDHSELEQLWNCFELNNIKNTYKNIRNCVIEFNKI